MSLTYATVVVCPGCGRRREVSQRHSRRKATCRDCAHSIKHDPPTDTERRWALEHFSDQEIVMIAEAMWGEKGSILRVRRERVRLHVL